MEQIILHVHVRSRDPYILGQCRAEAAHWGLTGLQKAVTEGMGPTPESVLRATAEAVQ